MKKFFKKLNLKKKSPGSSLIMVMIIMVNAILIMSAATAISYRQNKNSGVAKISAIAFQASDSGMEWALEEYRNASDTNTLSSEFGLSNTGTSLEKNGYDLGLDSNIKIKFYFLNNKGSSLLKGNDTIDQLYFIRSVATYEAGGGIKVSRALEAKVKEE